MTAVSPTAFADSLREHAESVAAEGGGARAAIHRIAGLDIAVRTNSAAALRLVTDALVGHGPGPGDRALAAPTWTIDLLSEVGGSALPQAWTWKDAVVNDEHVELRCDATNRTITMLCRRERWALVWHDGVRIQPWERAAPLRPVLDNVFGSLGLAMVHGGTLGIAVEPS